MCKEDMIEFIKEYIDSADDFLIEEFYWLLMEQQE